MLDLKGIKKTLEKLDEKSEPGEIRYEEEGRKEQRYSYLLNNIMIFTFGITRGSSVKSKRFSYVPRQMHLTQPEYRIFHDYTMSKEEYNRKLIDSGKFKGLSPNLSIP